MRSAPIPCSLDFSRAVVASVFLLVFQYFRQPLRREFVRIPNAEETENVLVVWRNCLSLHVLHRVIAVFAKQASWASLATLIFEAVTMFSEVRVAGVLSAVVRRLEFVAPPPR